ncbi:MAG: hypothetical protein AAFP19_16185 [Bacteroidota bacterium]
MINKLKKTIQQAGETIREQASSIGESALDRTYDLFEKWAEIFPRLEAYGLEIQSFGISAALSPSMEVVLTGPSADFTIDRVNEILEECKDSTILSSVFRTIKTTRDIHEKAKAPLFEDMHVKITVKIPPEIKVILGEPSLL